MSSSNSRRQPPVRIAPPPPAPPPPSLTWQERLRRWWRRFMDGPDAIPPPPSTPPAPVRIGYKVLAMALEYRCTMCGGKLLCELVKSEAHLARQPYFVGACVKSTCQMRDVRLRIPLYTVPDCELVE